MINQNDADDLNDAIAGWNRKNFEELKSRLDALGVEHRSYSPNSQPLKRALKTTLRKKFGMVDRISYGMPRSAIFLHKGVSKGHPITNPRAAKEWYTPVVEKNIDELTEIVADGQGTIIINSLKIK